jgi:hypothetical protein
MAATKSWRICGLWSKQTKGGLTLLQSKVKIDEIQKVINEAVEYGLEEAVIEIWANREPNNDRSPTHILKLAEPFVPVKVDVPNNQRQRQAIQNKRDFPF